MLVYGRLAQKMSAKREDTIREKVNNYNWRVHVAEMMLNWVHTLYTMIELEDNEVCCDEYFPVAVEYIWLKRGVLCELEKSI